MRLWKVGPDSFWMVNYIRNPDKVQQRDIVYITKRQKNVMIVIKGQDAEYERLTLQEIYKRLDNPDMYLLDRSNIINLQHVRKIMDYEIIMDNGHELITSRAHANELKEHLMLYWETRV